MPKNFDTWNSTKKIIEEKIITCDRYFHEGEIWWGSLGVNIGFEQDGKHENFERPLLIIKKFNRQIVWVVPLTSIKKQNIFHYYIKTTDSCVILSQIRLISTKRLLRYILKLNNTDFFNIIESTKELFPHNLSKTKPPRRGGFSGD